MKSSVVLSYSLVPQKSDRLPYHFATDQIIIGSGMNCDLVLTDQGVSHYHVCISIIGDIILVKDLNSLAGTTVNGKPISEAILSNGDVIGLGQVQLRFETEKAETPLVYVEDEYCNIVFKETGYTPLSELPKFKLNGEYIELDQTEKPAEIAFEIKATQLEVISYINGLINEVKYIKLKNKDYFIGPNADFPFETVKKTKFISIRDGKIKFLGNQELTPSCSWDKINLNDVLFLTKGAEQISFRLVNKAVRWKGTPLFFRDQEFAKQSTKIFLALFLPVLLLLFVTLPVPVKTEEETPVIYTLKKPEPAEIEEEKKELAASEENSDAESRDAQPDPEKVELAKAAAEQAAEAPKAEQPRAEPQPKKVVAQTRPAPVAPTQPLATPEQLTPTNKGTPVAAVKTAPEVPKKAPPMPYSFSSKTMDKLVGEAPSIDGIGKAKTKTIAYKSFSAGSADKGDLMGNAKVGISKLGGTNDKGSGDISYGARGLASKKGFDSASVETNTILQGSMDPELLRKILREYIPQFRHCYQQELTRHTERMNGVIELNFTINQNGKSTKPRIIMKNAQFTQEGVNCMVGVLKIIDFPKPKGGGVVDVKQPLSFIAENAR